MRVNLESEKRPSHIWPLCATLFGICAHIQTAQSAILVTFEHQTTGILTATITGTLDLNGLTRTDDDISVGRTRNRVGTGNQLSSLVAPGYDSYQGELVASFGVNTPVSRNLSVSFGFNGNTIFLPSTVGLNETVVVDSTWGFWSWQNATLENIGLGNITSTPLTVWNNPNASGTDGAIQFVSIGSIPVPEPSSNMLSAFAGLLIWRRRR